MNLKEGWNSSNCGSLMLSLRKLSNASLAVHNLLRDKSQKRFAWACNWSFSFDISSLSLSFLLRLFIILSLVSTEWDRVLAPFSVLWSCFWRVSIWSRVSESSFARGGSFSFFWRSSSSFSSSSVRFTFSRRSLTSLSFWVSCFWRT